MILYYCVYFILEYRVYDSVIDTNTDASMRWQKQYRISDSFATHCRLRPPVPESGSELIFRMELDAPQQRPRAAQAVFYGE